MSNVSTADALRRAHGQDHGKRLLYEEKELRKQMVMEAAHEDEDALRRQLMKLKPGHLILKAAEPDYGLTDSDPIIIKTHQAWQSGMPTWEEAQENLIDTMIGIKYSQFGGYKRRKRTRRKSTRRKSTKRKSTRRKSTKRKKSKKRKNTRRRR